MATSKKSGTTRRRQRRTKVSIGGISQSAFAGYAPSSARQPSAAEKPGNDSSASDEQTRKEQTGKDQVRKEED